MNVWEPDASALELIVLVGSSLYFYFITFPNAEDESHVYSHTYEEIKYITIFAGMIR